ncbi:MAG TPA: FAD:protein FMN transferase, partial [Gaiellaceae bacterium]|nr:FAD:protein FMN transferase [Gaiellaceae bacterium]
MTGTHSFPAMGTEVELFGDPAGFAAAETEFERLEKILSRFRPDSELSRLNRDGRIAAGADLRRVVRLALDARERTGGLFDPTVHDALVAAGYDASFDLLDRDRPRAAAAVACSGRVAIVGSEIVLEPGVRLDLGGIGKGYAVDRAVALLGAYGPALVNAGGDLACRGGSWPVGVETSAGVLTIALERGALATSGSDRRAWAGGHHLIDPRTGTSAESAYLRVTVAAPTAAGAEVLAKAIYLGADP